MMRPLKAKDTRTLAGIFKLAIKSGKAAWIENIIVAPKKGEQAPVEDEDNSKWINFFSEILVILLDDFEPQVTAWFADINQITVDEYLNSDIDIDILTIQHIKEDEKFKDFLSKAWDYVKNQKWYATISSAMKNAYATISDTVEAKLEN